MLRALMSFTWVLALSGQFGCTSINKSHMNESIDVKIDAPMEAKIDVDLSRKLTGYASGGFLFHFFLFRLGCY